MTQFAEGDRVEISAEHFDQLAGLVGTIERSAEDGYYNHVKLDDGTTGAFLDSELVLVNPFADGGAPSLSKDASAFSIKTLMELFNRITAPDEVEVPDLNDERDEWNYGALDAAGRHDRVAVFSYTKGESGALEVRHFTPEAIYDARDNSTVIFVGFDHDRQDIRAFRLDRVQGYVAVS